MAVVEIWDVKGQLGHSLDYIKNPEKTNGKIYTKENLEGLRDVIDYASNEHKTYASDEEHFVSGINCNPDKAKEEMLAVKEIFNDKKEIVCFHAYQSFAPNETDSKTAHEIGMKLAREMWGKEFQVLVATHLNTDCLHSHFVVNSTNFVNGKRFYDNKRNLRKMRNISDKLCRKYKLSIVENPLKTKTTRFLETADKKGLPTRYNIARKIIDEAINTSFTMADFEKKLEKAGYEFNFSERRKHWTITPKGYNKPIRLEKLGEDYSKERIAERLKEKPIYEKIKACDEEKLSKKIFEKGFKFLVKPTKLYKLYVHYCYMLGVFPEYKTRNIPFVNKHLRDDLMKAKKILKITNFLCEHEFSSLDELENYQKLKEKELYKLLKARKNAYNSRSYTANVEMREVLSEKIHEISKKIREIGEEIDSCCEVAINSIMVQEKMDRVRADEKLDKTLENRKEVDKNLSF